ncbi:hypothetical protein N5D61_11180 [Pseudomonas sp. GD03842]|uniref:PA0061/PA0062 family lipoprotein n=1 Tax=Pseudomonas sp. GD03842 TaxID=2975385 RepID=UPI002448BCC3|nr:hypothetical protein [Pseudomonas sp. GD03842]MDH0746907.1 hypothetical protein [Pseudomonas sp. GD03842]
MSILNPIGCATLLLLLAACATEASRPEDGQTVVDLRPTPGNEMVARRLGQAPVSNMNSFRFTGSKQSLEIGLARQDYRGIHRRCVTTLNYDDFQPDQRYSITEGSVDGQASVRLADSNGRVVAQVDKIPCL